MWPQLKVKAWGNGEVDKLVSKPRALLSYLVHSLKSTAISYFRSLIKSIPIKKLETKGKAGKKNSLKN